MTLQEFIKRLIQTTYTFVAKNRNVTVILSNSDQRNVCTLSARYITASGTAGLANIHI